MLIIECYVTFIAELSFQYNLNTKYIYGAETLKVYGTKMRNISQKISVAIIINFFFSAFVDKLSVSMQVSVWIAVILYYYLLLCIFMDSGFNQNQTMLLTF